MLWRARLGSKRRKLGAEIPLSPGIQLLAAGLLNLQRVGLLMEVSGRWGQGVGG